MPPKLFDLIFLLILLFSWHSVSPCPLVVIGTDSSSLSRSDRSQFELLSRFWMCALCVLISSPHLPQWTMHDLFDRTPCLLERYARTLSFPSWPLPPSFSSKALFGSIVLVAAHWEEGGGVSLHFRTLTLPGQAGWTHTG